MSGQNSDHYGGRRAAIGLERPGPQRKGVKISARERIAMWKTDSRRFARSSRPFQLTKMTTKSHMIRCVHRPRPSERSRV